MTAELLPAGEVEVTVADDGTWREPADPAPVTSGRGLWFVGETVDVLHLTHAGPRDGADTGDLAQHSGTTARVRLAVHRPAVLAAGRHHDPRRDAPVPFRIDTVESVDGVPAVLHVHGTVDITTAHELADRIAVVSRGGVNPVRLDLTEVDILASTAVRVLFVAREQHAVHGHRLTLTTAAGSLADQVLSLVRFEHVNY